MKIIVIGAGIAGLCTATLLVEDGHEVQLIERNPTAGGRAAAPDGVEHCSRIFLDDYASLRQILTHVGSRGAGPLWDMIRPITRIVRDEELGWRSVGGPYVARSKSLPLREKIRLARLRRESPLLADHRRPTSRELASMALQLSPAGWIRLARLTLRVQAAYALPGPTDDFLLEPWLAHLEDAGVEYRSAESVQRLTSRQGQVYAIELADGESISCDAVVVASSLPGAIALLDSSLIKHHLRCSPLALHSLTSATFTIDASDSALEALPSPDPSLIAGSGFYVVIPAPVPALCGRERSVCTGLTHCSLVEEASKLLRASLPVDTIGSTTNRLPDQQLFGATPPARRHLPTDRGLYLAGSYLSRSYPLDSGEAAARSAFNVRDSIRGDS